jgi:hypothetical protein
MKILTANDAKYGFGRLIDFTHAEPVAGTKHGAHRHGDGSGGIRADE